jgi:hypothetical protein
MAVNDGAVVYEVTLRVDRAIAVDYLAWLRIHVGQMLALPGFLDATLYAIDVDVVADDDRIGWCVQYRLRDRAALDSYFREHASQLRAEGLARFGTRFRAERRILHVMGDT